MPTFRVLKFSLLLQKMQFMEQRSIVGATLHAWREENKQKVEHYEAFEINQSTFDSRLLVQTDQQEIEVVWQSP